MTPAPPSTVFTELSFWALVLFSLVLPSAIFVTLFVRRAFSKATVLMFGLLLIALAGADLVLLHALSAAARATPSLADDRVFSSELSVALYIFPAAYGTLGFNMASHVLMHFLKKKEQLFEANHAVRPREDAAAHRRPRTLNRRPGSGLARDRPATSRRQRAAALPLAPPLALDGLCKTQPHMTEIDPISEDGTDDGATQEPRLWSNGLWTARVIKNEDDDGWAVSMTRRGEAEPALVGPWTMGRDKKNPKPLDTPAFHTLVKTAAEVLRRHEQQLHAQLNKHVNVGNGSERIRVALQIVPDEDNPHALLTAQDEFGVEVGQARVAPTFKLSAASAEAWIESGYAARPR